MNNIRLRWKTTEQAFLCKPGEQCAPVQSDAPFRVQARPGARQTVQLMLLSDADATVTGLEIDIPWTMHVPALRGVDQHGKPFVGTVRLRAGRPWPIWVLLEVPMTAQGEHAATVTVTCQNGDTRAIALTVAVSGEIDPHHSEDDAASLARFSWLNSTLGNEDTVTAPYHAIKTEGNRFSVLGREITLGSNGIPTALTTRFAGINERLLPQGEDILTGPVRLEAILADGQPLAMDCTCRVLPEQSSQTHVVWEAQGTGAHVQYTLRGQLDYTGWMHYDVTWSAIGAEVAVADIRLVFALKERYARWFSGVNYFTGDRPAEHRWAWQPEKHQDAFFCGGMNGGVVVRPVQEEYVRPFCNIYYRFGPTNQPKAWVNDGKGEFLLRGTEMGYHTGAITLQADAKVHTNFDLGFTPFKLINPAEHYATRYFQEPDNTSPDLWLKTADEIGASHIIVHHGKDIYPFINYPMFDAPAMGDLVAEAHRRGKKLKCYYTIRELTSRLPEYPIWDRIYPSKKTIQLPVTAVNAVKPIPITRKKENSFFLYP